MRRPVRARARQAVPLLCLWPGRSNLPALQRVQAVSADLPLWRVNITYREPTWDRWSGRPVQDRYFSFVVHATDAGSAERQVRRLFDHYRDNTGVGGVREGVSVDVTSADG